MRDTHPNSAPGGTLKLIAGLSLLLAAALIIVACSDLHVTGLPTPGASKLTVTISDPATCQSPSGPYSHVYVTIADVLANTSDSADVSDSGWVDLTPNLSASPMQVDLLGKADARCVLATLGDNSNLAPGSYKQFRVILAADTAMITQNACGNSASCVVLASDSSVHPLEIVDEATAGIKLTSSEYVGPGNLPLDLTIAANQSKYLDINFLACESIVHDKQGNYRLKPVVSAGELKAQPNSLRGKVLDGGTGQPVKGVVVVALERPDRMGVGRIVRATLAEADGSFTFCPLPVATYHLVVVGTSADGAFYEPSIIFAIHVGSQANKIGDVKLYPLSPTATSFVTLTGMVATQTSGHLGTLSDVTVSVVEKAANQAPFTIPMSPTSIQSSATLNTATAAPNSSSTCFIDTYCADYSIQVPAGSLNFADFKKDGTNLTSNATLPTYQIDAGTFIPSSGGVVSCTGSPARTQPFTPSAGGVTVPVPAFWFRLCK